MSEEQLKAFIAKVQEDTKLQEHLKAEGADHVAIAKAAGFVFTNEHLKTYRQNLSDAELESAAGGGACWDTEPVSVYGSCGVCGEPHGCLVTL